MGDFAEEIGIGRRKPETVYRPTKPAQTVPANAMVNAAFLACYGMLSIAVLFLPKDQR